jgi:hypothetical protein
MRSKRKRILLGLGLLVVTGLAVARLMAPPHFEAWLESVKAVGRTNLLGQYDREITLRYRFGASQKELLHTASVELWRSQRWEKVCPPEVAFFPLSASQTHGDSSGRYLGDYDPRSALLKLYLGPWLTNAPLREAASSGQQSFRIPPEVGACRLRLDYFRPSSVTRLARLLGSLGLDPWGENWAGRFNDFLCTHLLFRRYTVVVQLPPNGAEFPTNSLPERHGAELQQGPAAVK